MGINEIKLKFNILDNRTVKKCILDLIPTPLHIDRVKSVYLVTGNLDKSSEILKVSKTTVFRILKKNGVKVGKGTKNWKSLYGTLRRRVTTSKWRKNIIERDGGKCCRCDNVSNTVHHITKLSDIRDSILIKYPDLDPFKDYKSLRCFTDLVMKEHDNVEGEVLCTLCHELEHKYEKR